MDLDVARGLAAKVRPVVERPIGCCGVGCGNVEMDRNDERGALQ